MRDYVEIGIGREARRAYELEDIAVIPNRRTRSSKDVDTTWQIDAYTFEVPFMTHPTDALAGVEFVQAVDQLGGLAVINAEGLLGRHEDPEAAVDQILEIQQAYSSGNDVIETLQKLHAAELNLDLLRDRIAQVRDTGATVAVRVSPQHCRELAPVIIAAGADILVVQGTIISAEHVEKTGEPLNLKDFIGSVDIPVIAGGVHDYTTALHLMRAGAVGVIVGSSAQLDDDGGYGINMPGATAIADAAAARRDYLDETEGRYVHIIADTNIVNAGDVVKALACGADAVVLGIPLSQAEEALGKGLYWESTAAHPRFPRGTVYGPAENLVPLRVILDGPSTEVYGRTNFIGGIKRALAKCGYTDIKSFHKVGLAVRPTL
ncbi:MAG: GuaB3 family IMP dehydrogenase-related protein [Corynebacterium sp.]|nr:GuaB3 family IMP dehydrogenase-related protein [Corynebacterium sp.]